MATWDQSTNSGGLLAGIGGQNENAPRTNDINTTLGLIRDNNDFARAGGNNVALTGLQGLVGVAEQYQQGRQQQRQGEFQKAYGAAFQSGDRGAMRDLAAQYPEQFESVQKGMGFIDDDHRNTIGTLATSAQLAAIQGPKGFTSWLKGTASELQRVGLNPDDVATMYQQNPEGFQQLAGNMAMFSLGPEKAFEVQDKMAGREIDRGQLAESVRHNQASEENTRQGQNLSYQSAMTGHNLAAQRLSLDQQKFGFDIQQAEQKAQQLISDAPKLSVNMEKSIEKSVNDSTASLNSANSMSALAQQFRQEKPTTGLFGSANNMFAKLTGNETALRDLRIRQNSIVNSQVLKFLPPGPATDRDVAIAREGAPSTWDDPELVANWLDANARLERRAAQFNDFKAEWMSANGNPGQSRNGGQVLGMEVKKGESLGSAAKRYMAQNPIAEPTADARKPELPTYQAKQQYGQTQAQAQQAAQRQSQRISDDDLVSKYLGGK